MHTHAHLERKSAPATYLTTALNTALLSLALTLIYRRQRVMASCGSDEACDLTTAKLLTWTRGLERQAVPGAGPGAG